MRKLKTIASLTAGLAVAAVCSANGAILINGGFDVPQSGLTPPTYPTSTSGGQVAGNSSAEGWEIYNNNPVTTSTELLPTTDPLATGTMMHVATPRRNDGIFQFFPEQSNLSISIDVFVNSGQVFLGLYTNNGTTRVGSAYSTTTGAWETLTISFQPGQCDEVVVYSSKKGADFFVDRAMTPVPEPSTYLAGLSALGMLGVFGWRNRK